MVRTPARSRAAINLSFAVVLTELTTPHKSVVGIRMDRRLCAGTIDGQDWLDGFKGTEVGRCARHVDEAGIALHHDRPPFRSNLTSSQPPDFAGD